MKVTEQACFIKFKSTDDAAKALCLSANKESCTEGVGSTACGACLSGFKLDGGICVDVCDAAAQVTCQGANKASCSAGLR